MKIKENKLQELEKFGFEKRRYIDDFSKYVYVYVYDIYESNVEFVNIEVLPDRTIFLSVVTDGIFIDKLDILYELFANDMIEKVEDY